MALGDITRAQVLAAITECDKLGKEVFLREYGFKQARSYLLIHNEKAYDSKAIVGVAHGLPPGDRRLHPSEFSGGEATVARLLRRLGFTVSVSEQLTVQELVRQISTLKVDRSSGRPALYQPITLLWAIGRAHRGEPRLESWESTQLQLGELLERYGHRGARARADYPVAALHGAGLWELTVGATPVPVAHGDAELRRWFQQNQPRGGLVTTAYNLVRRSGEARVMVLGSILDTFFPETDCVDLLEAVGLSGTWIAAVTGVGDDEPSASPLEDAYRRLCGIVVRGNEQHGGRRVTRTTDKLVRSTAARSAVLLRSGGNCENPRCTGQAQDLTDSGNAILEIDHIQDLALGGPDDPVQMIALCPNCHAIKTRGSTRKQLRELLVEIALQRHMTLAADIP